MYVLKGVYVYTPSGDSWGLKDVVIENGVIAKITSGLYSSNKAYRNYRFISFDYESYLIPAMIDPHVHVREPGFEYKEDWETCSKAALKGGVGVIIDMPNNKEPIDSVDRLKIKDEIAKRKSLVNYGLYVALTDENADLISRNFFYDYICGIKIYMSKTTGGLLVESTETIKKALLQEKPVLAHTGGVEGLTKLMNAVEDVYSSVGKIPTVYICHVSKADEVKIIGYYKRKYKNIVAEVTPHHLFLTKDIYRGLPRVLPPLEGEEDVDALWVGIEDGTIDILGTDHAPHTVEEKKSEKPPAGFPGLETALPLMFEAAMKGRFGLSKLIDMTSTKASEIFRLKGFGKIQENYPANCTVLVKDSWKVGEYGYATRCGWSPFKGRELEYRVVLTFINGNLSYENGSYVKGEIKRLCTQWG